MPTEFMDGIDDTLASQGGRGWNKSLEMTVRPYLNQIWYIVKDHGVYVHEGSDLNAACDAYNNIRK